MTQYLVFDNQSTAGLGTQKELVINWSNIKQLRPVSTSKFKIELNNGGNLEFSLTFSSSSNPAAFIEAIGKLVKSQANGRVLRVKPKTIGGFVVTGITYSAPATLASIPSNINSSSDILILGSSASSAGPSNTGYGFDAMSSITASADSNTAVGEHALQNCDSDDNTAVGYNALRMHVGGNKNTAIGYECMETSGDSEGASNSNNTFVGAQSGKDIDEGCSDNVGMGRSALQNLGTSGTSGNQNTAIGSSAGSNLQGAANNNTMLGYNAEPSGSSVSNEFVLGNSSVGVLRCAQGTISALSDERDKTSIEDLPYGLDFVDSLKPKRFVWDNRAEIRFVDDEEGNRVIEEEYFSANKGKKDVGFIAQELQTVDDDFLNLVYDSNPDKLEASYSKLIPVLVKAIQELKAELDKKQDK
tara:strand:+ start:322 stop:1566 length:1245 start_codon:yes stop_codon:yes gene_type:complete